MLVMPDGTQVAFVNGEIVRVVLPDVQPARWNGGLLGGKPDGRRTT